MNTAVKKIEKKFSELIAEVKSCNKCPRMKGSERVLGPASGSLQARVVFVGEAPGRLGADESQIPFHGDKSGHNFESLIEQVGLSRYELFVTNAVLCNPKDSKGNNSTPTPTEIQNCAGFLRRQIDLIDPQLVVTLGSTALKACALVEPHNLELRTHVRTSHVWMNRKIVPNYHPGQRAMIHRSFANQLADYQFISEQIKRAGKKARQISPKISSKGTKELIEKITSKKSSLSYFALHKLVFLVEARALDELGERLTDSYIIRQKDGPYCVDLHPKKLIQLGLFTSLKYGSLYVEKTASMQLFEGEEAKPYFDAQQTSLIDAVIAKYGNLSDTELKRAAYCTSAMRAMLRKEKTLGVNLFNAPLLVPERYQDIVRSDVEAS